MEVHVKRFDQLTIHELYDILKLRNSIFVVEQNCAFGDVDGFDKEAYHVFITDEDGIQAYLRVLDRNTVYDDVSFGRVLAVKRHYGLATRVLEAGIRVAKEHFDADRIVLHAEAYARGLYEKIGFQQTSEEFLEDNIPFIRMEMKLALDIAC